jgi:hypothetical protein
MYVELELLRAKPVGASGTLAAMTASAGLDKADSPTEFCAETFQLYFVPVISPVDCT